MVDLHLQKNYKYINIEVHVIHTSFHNQRKFLSVIYQLPRNICLKRHSLPCKSLATNSCVGGCLDMSCENKIQKKTLITNNTNETNSGKNTNFLNKLLGPYQWRKAFISMSSQNRKSTMCTSIRSSQRLTKRMNTKL